MALQALAIDWQRILWEAPGTSQALQELQESVEGMTFATMASALEEKVAEVEQGLRNHLQDGVGQTTLQRELNELASRVEYHLDRDEAADIAATVVEGWAENVDISTWVTDLKLDDMPLLEGTIEDLIHSTVSPLLDAAMAEFDSRGRYVMVQERIDTPFKAAIRQWLGLR